MKKFLLVLIMNIILVPTTPAQDLNFNGQLNLKNSENVIPQKLEINSSSIDGMNIESRDSLLEKANAMYSNPYEKKSTSFKQERKFVKNKFGQMSVGSQTDATVTPDTLTRKNTMYTKYEKNKFSVDTSYQNSSTNFDSNMSGGTVTVTPGYKMNEHMSIQNRNSTDLTSKDKKSEMVFSVKPFKDDRMDFNVGAGQVYSETSAPVRSQLNFSTKINF